MVEVLSHLHWPLLNYFELAKLFKVKKYIKMVLGITRMLTWKLKK